MPGASEAGPGHPRREGRTTRPPRSRRRPATPGAGARSARRRCSGPAGRAARPGRRAGRHLRVMTTAERSRADEGHAASAAGPGRTRAAHRGGGRGAGRGRRRVLRPARPDRRPRRRSPPAAELVDVGKSALPPPGRAALDRGAARRAGAGRAVRASGSRAATRSSSAAGRGDARLPRRRACAVRVVPGGQQRRRGAGRLRHPGHPPRAQPRVHASISGPPAAERGPSSTGLARLGGTIVVLMGDRQPRADRRRAAPRRDGPGDPGGRRRARLLRLPAQHVQPARRPAADDARRLQVAVRPPSSSSGAVVSRRPPGLADAARVHRRPARSGPAPSRRTARPVDRSARDRPPRRVAPSRPSRTPGRPPACGSTSCAGSASASPRTAGPAT